MAQALHIGDGRWHGRIGFALAGLALWQIAGCVIPPPEPGEERNSPPWIDWPLTTPEGVETSLQLSENPVKQFSIEGAVFDPEGDDIDYIWYWVDPDGRPFPLVGKGSTTLEGLCQYASIAKLGTNTGQTITVHVVVSDFPLKWLGMANPTQPVETSVDDDGEPFPLIKRFWVVRLNGECQ